MNLADFRDFAWDLMSQHGIEDWKLILSKKMVSTYGTTNSYRKQIEINLHFVMNNPWSKIKDTILHEIAHAIVGTCHQHDEVWRLKAIEIGCNGQRCGREFIKTKEWIGICSICNLTISRHKRKKFRHCNVRMQWKRNPKAIMEELMGLIQN